MQQRVDDIAGLSLLLVEDDDMVRELVMLAAEELGAQVDAVCSGRDALSRLRERTYDVVITDLKMSEVTGFDVIEEARRVPAPPGLVVVTGFADRADERAIEQLGATLVHKPFRAEEFALAVASSSRRRVGSGALPPQEG